MTHYAMLPAPVNQFEAARREQIVVNCLATRLEATGEPIECGGADIMPSLTRTFGMAPNEILNALNRGLEERRLGITYGPQFEDPQLLGEQVLQISAYN